MTETTRVAPTRGWDWRIETPFANTVTHGDQVFVSGQQALGPDGAVAEPGDIAGQTRAVFEAMARSLAAEGLGLADLVRLNTYYVFDGAEAEATRYWEDMTRVRLEFFPDPGPAATAVRIKGMPYAGQLIQIEGIALRGEARRSRQRVMPADSWDWSIAVPLSQGWRVGSHLYVGGQIAADSRGEAVDAGNLEAQTRAVYRYIANVLRDGGARAEDLVHVKICFKHDSRDAGRAYVDRILEITRDVLGDAAPAVTAFGVDLLYPGLELEIDAMAIVDPGRRALGTDGAGTLAARYQPAGFAESVRAGGEIRVGGQVALGGDGVVVAPGDIRVQARHVFERLADRLAAQGAGLGSVVKLELFLVGDGPDVAEDFHDVARVWAEMAPGAHPAVTPVRVHELARPGLRIQADCIAAA
ncbi:MAG: Rid family hydrolase [Azospirillaceae bacterium]